MQGINRSAAAVVLLALMSACTELPQKRNNDDAAVPSVDATLSDGDHRDGDHSGPTTMAMALSGEGADSVTDIAVDSLGNLVITGYFGGSATFGTQTLSAVGFDDIFVAKLDPEGTVLWAKALGGPELDLPYGVSVGPHGNIYVAGYFGGGSFGNKTVSASGGMDAFIAKLDPDGETIWVNAVGGDDGDEGSNASVNDDGDVLLTGAFRASMTVGETKLTAKGERDVFVVQLDADGKVRWAKSFGGKEDDYAIGGFVSKGRRLLCGQFRHSITLDRSLSSKGETDVFVAELDGKGEVLWSAQAGGSGADYCSGVTADDDGRAYVYGSFFEAASFGEKKVTSGGDHDLFVAQLDTNGSFGWVTTAGGPGWDTAETLAISNAELIVGGTFNEVLSIGDRTLSCRGEGDVFVAALDSSGKLLWVEEGGGQGNDHMGGVAASSQHHIFVGGSIGADALFGDAALTALNPDAFIWRVDRP